MKKKLDTRFPAARIKKIMQADEDVGKIAMAVPVLVSKALELFLQDLCDRTYDITLHSGAKTVNSLHLKHCVQRYNVFDFLREVVSKVPDYGHSEAGADDRTMAKRKKAAADELNGSDEESKRNRVNEAGHTTSSGSGRGRGRPRGRGRGRGRVSAERDPPLTEPESESSTLPVHHSKQDLGPHGPMNNQSESIKSKSAADISTGGIDLDLNAGCDENTDKGHAAADGGAPPPLLLPVAEPIEAANSEYPGWSVSEIDRMDVDPNLAQVNSRLDVEDEDYDEE
ncbi:hypothetical protein R6Q59_028147 [Mikania micrantha]